MKFITTLILIFTVFLACEKASLYDISKGDYNTPKAVNTLLNATERQSSFAFIAGYDEDDNTYYTNAATYFKNQSIPVIKGLHSLEEIIDFLNNSNSAFSEIHIISHSNPWAGMALKTHVDGERITVHNLTKALNLKQLPVMGSSIDETTKIIFHSCGLGENIVLTKLLKTAFTSNVTPQIIASPYFNVFGGDYVPHYLAKPYYVAYPTAHSPGARALAEEMALTYPESTINWQLALTTREETTPTTIYSYRFNVPVQWEFFFNDVSEIPQLNTRDAIMDFVSAQDALAKAIFELGIPIEKYRWIIKISEANKTLTLKGKTTVLCVLEPIVNSNDPGNYAQPVITNENLYTVF